MTPRCPVCGHAGDDVRPVGPGRFVCPACGETFGRPGPAARRDVSGRVTAVGAAVAAVGGLTLLVSAAWLTFVAVAVPPPAPPANIPPAQRRGFEVGYWTAQAVPSVAGLAMAVVEIAAGAQILRRRTWGFAVFGTIVGMLPCGCAAVVGLPVGAWALVVLFDPDAKATFR